MNGPIIREAIPFPSILLEVSSFFSPSFLTGGIPGNVPVTKLGLPLGYGFPGIIPQEEIMATGALQPTLQTCSSILRARFFSEKCMRNRSSTGR